MAQDDKYRVSILAQGQGSYYQNVYAVRFKATGDPTVGMFNTFASDVVAPWTAAQSTTINYLEWTATQLWGPNMTIVANKCLREGGNQYAGVMTQAGAVAVTEALPPQSAMVVTWLTGTTGRRKRGRTYGFGMVEGAQDQGLWSTATITGMTGRLTTFINLYRASTGTSPNFELGVWSERIASGCVPAPPPQKGHVPVDTPHPELAFTPIMDYSLRPVVYSQRRRTRGVGR